MGTIPWPIATRARCMWRDAIFDLGCKSKLPAALVSACSRASCSPRGNPSEQSWMKITISCFIGLGISQMTYASILLTWSMEGTSSSERLRDRDRYKGDVTYVQAPPQAVLSLSRRIRGAARRGLSCHMPQLAADAQRAFAGQTYGLLVAHSDRRG